MSVAERTQPASGISSRGLFIDGGEVAASNPELIDVRNPATGAVIARIPHANAADVDRAVASARTAFESREWGGMETRARAKLVNKLADAFEANLEELYHLETLNNGRPLNETRAQLRRLPDFFRYNAGLALARRDAVIPVEGNYLNYTLRTPIGVVGNCTPFNHPLMIMCKSLAPVFASGCVTVVKPSEYTPLTTLALARIFTEAGLPGGVFNIVTGLGPTTGKFVCEHPGLNKLVLTGGTEAGQIAGSAAGRNLAHQTLELGGKTPVLVFPDFDLDQAVNYAAFGAFIGAGQTCVCGSRHIVHADMYDAFVEKLATKAKSIRIGDPTEAATQLGPVISEKQRQRVLNYVRYGLDEGARLVAGGKIPEHLADSGGFFVEPTVFADVDARDAHLPGRSVRPLHLGDALRDRGGGHRPRQQLALRPRRRHPHPRHRAGPSRRVADDVRHHLDQRPPPARPRLAMGRLQTLGRRARMRHEVVRRPFRRQKYHGQCRRPALRLVPGHIEPATLELKRDQEKWNPVFRPIARPAKNRERAFELRCFHLS